MCIRDRIILEVDGSGEEMEASKRILDEAVLYAVSYTHLDVYKRQDAGDLPAAKDCLQKAVRLARRFDTAPVYTMKNIRFYHEKEPLLLSDSFGETAMQGLENSILHGTAEGLSLIHI